MVLKPTAMKGARVPSYRLYEDAAERALEQDVTADVALAGFPASWREPELQICLGAVCDCDRLWLVKDHSGISVCLLKTRPSTVPALLVARLRTSNLAREGLRAVLANRKDVVHQVPKALSQHQFQAEERGALHGLRSQTELNGSSCSIVRFDEDSRRWLVRLDIESEDNEILVSAANLLPLWLMEEADPAPKEAAKNLETVAATESFEAKAEAPNAEAEVVEDETADQLADREERDKGEIGEAALRGEALEDAQASEAVPEEKSVEPAVGQTEDQEMPGQAEEETVQAAASAGPKAEAKGKVKMSHALVVTGFPLWDLQQITQYFARFGELRTILGATKNKNGKRKLLVAYCKKVNAKRSQAHVHGAEIDGHKLSAVFADDTFPANKQEAKAAARSRNHS